VLPFIKKTTPPAPPPTEKQKKKSEKKKTLMPRKTRSAGAKGRKEMPLFVAFSFCPF